MNESKPGRYAQAMYEAIEKVWDHIEKCEPSHEKVALARITDLIGCLICEMDRLEKKGHRFEEFKRK